MMRSSRKLMMNDLRIPTMTCSCQVQGPLMSNHHKKTRLKRTIVRHATVMHHLRWGVPSAAGYKPLSKWANRIVTRICFSIWMNRSMTSMTKVCVKVRLKPKIRRCSRKYIVGCHVLMKSRCLISRWLNLLWDTQLPKIQNQMYWVKCLSETAYFPVWLSNEPSPLFVTRDESRAICFLENICFDLSNFHHPMNLSMNWLINDF